MRIKIQKNGPYIVSGNVPLYKEDIINDENDIPISFGNRKKIAADETYGLCRCGMSKNKPFCDGSHEKNNFKGDEIAKKSFDNDDKIIKENDNIKLVDIPSLCDHSRFCTRAGGIRKLIKKGNDESDEIANEEASLCPSGRLTIIDKNTQKTSEKDFEKEIVLLYDTGKEKNGPIWVKGNIPIECSDGKEYEIQNKQTLCRCGKSLNKPSCDGRHWVSEKFQKDFRKKWNID